MFQLKQTCGGCPEQYDVYLDNEVIGYMRLRNGYFRAEYKGKVVYDCNPKGDGVFDWDERERILNEACAAIKAAMVMNSEILFEIIN